MILNDCSLTVIGNKPVELPKCNVSYSKAFKIRMLSLKTLHLDFYSRRMFLKIIGVFIKDNKIN